jgi:hypothetical protein
MVRLQIQLEPSQHRQVKRRAKGLGVSVAEVIRRCVDAQLQADGSRDPDEPARRLMAVAGKYRDTAGGRDVARRHDARLVEAFRR